ncbi:MAG: LysR family transcriptional regulator, partial [Myxococcota bacterium]
MDLLSIRLFLRVSDLGGISAAARDLSLSPASASARLSTLEKALGFRLFNRTTRAVSLTTDGAEFLPYAQQSLETLESGLNVVRGESAAVTGLIRMTMPGSFGRMHILPLLTDFHERYPGVTLDLRLSDEVLDVIEGAYDLIIRNAPLRDSTVVARKLAPDRRLLVAAPSYLERHGAPSTPHDLKSHRCVVLLETNRWKFETNEVIEVDRAFGANDGEATRAMAENGLGISISSLWNAGPSLDSGRLVEVLPDFPLVTESAIWALYPSKRLVPPRVRAMLDFLVERFSPVAPWER